MSEQPDTGSSDAASAPDAADAEDTAKLAAGPVNAPGVGTSATPRAAAAAGKDASATPGGAPAQAGPAPAATTTPAPEGDAPAEGSALADKLPPQLAGVAAKAQPQYEQLQKDKPELLVAGAFAAGFVVAKVLRLLGR